MDDETKGLKGSEARDAFKRWHKELSRRFYGCDADFILVDKHPHRISAVLDYKDMYDSVQFSEIIAYNHFLRSGIPVYIVRSRWNKNRKDVIEWFNTFSIYRYEISDPNPDPPEANLKRLKKYINIEEYKQWEESIRKLDSMIDFFLDSGMSVSEVSSVLKVVVSLVIKRRAQRKEG